MSFALRRDYPSPRGSFDDDYHTSISICDKLLSMPDGLSSRIGSKLRRLDLKLGKFLVELTAEIEKVQQSQSRTQCGWSREKEGDWGYRERPRRRQHHPHRSRSRHPSRGRSDYYLPDDWTECRTIEGRPRCLTHEYIPEIGSRRQILDDGCTGREIGFSHSNDGLITTPFVAPLRFPVPKSAQRLSLEHRSSRDINRLRPPTGSDTTLWQENVVSQSRSNTQSRPDGISNLSSSHDPSSVSVDRGRQVRLPSQGPTPSRGRTRSFSGPAINPDTGLPFRPLPAPRDIPKSLLRSCLEFTGHNPNRVAFSFDEAQTARLKVPKRPMRSKKTKKTKTSKTSKKTQNSRDRPPGPIPDISLPVTSAQLRAFSDNELEFFNKLTKDCSSEAKESVQKAKDHHRDWMKETSGH